MNSGRKPGNDWRGNDRSAEECGEESHKAVGGVFWILPTEVPWRDLPPDYGDWKNTHRRFCRWRDKGIWEKLLENLSPEPELKWLMMDFSHMKVHPHGVGAKGGNWEMGRTRGATPNCIFSWMRLSGKSGLQ